MRIRQFDGRDAEAVSALDSWAMRDAGTEPTDIPGHQDIERIDEVYLEDGGEFVVGVIDRSAAEGVGFDECASRLLETFDGCAVAMGGFLPSERGYADERAVADACELHRMRVAPPLQGQGYGINLLRELESRATSSGYRRLVATTAKRQQRAVAFYPAAGYEQVGESTYGEYELIHFEKLTRL